MATSCTATPRRPLWVLAAITIIAAAAVLGGLAGAGFYGAGSDKHKTTRSSVVHGEWMKLSTVSWSHRVVMMRGKTDSERGSRVSLYTSNL
jgi:hypothetical protein